ncbi:MAG: DUF4340 domain-containing protein [SAR202 cluster bacterium]|nr:DUF4340 domain-containing protein [SAR202 cluster bacterium]
MKSNQVGYVLIALIAVGLAGLVFRVVARTGPEHTLAGLVQVSTEASDRITISNDEFEAELIKLGDDTTGYAWFIDDKPVFTPKLDQFWLAVSDLYSAQLIAENPNSQTRIGVADGEGVTVSFFLGRRSLQEQFIIGQWKPDVRLCYIRRAGHDEVYGVPCPQGNIFDPRPDGWKNPVVAAIPPEEVAAIEFSYLDQQFLLAVTPDNEWVLVAEDGTGIPTNPLAVQSVLGNLQILVSSGFAEEDEADELNFAVPDAMIRVITKQGAPTATTRLRFLIRDETSLYLTVPTQPTVFIVDQQSVGGLLLRREAFLTDGQ